MSKLHLNNNLLKKLDEAKYNLELSKYPEIKEIFDVKKYDLSFKESYEAHKYLKKEKKYYLKKHSNIEYIYQDFLYELAHLINNIKYDPNIKEIMYIYDYLCYNGFLSNNTFQFTMPSHELEFRKGLSIFTGESVCRNIGGMFVDLLNIFSIKSIGTITERSPYNSEKNILREEYSNLKDFILEEFHHEFEDSFEKKDERGNHYEVLVYDKKWYLADPTSICFYSITEETTNYPALDNLCLWSLYALGEYSLKKTIKVYNFFRNKYLKIHKSDKTLQLQKECYNKCESEKDKIYKFYKDTYKHRYIINQFMQKK